VYFHAGEQRQYNANGMLPRTELMPDPTNEPGDRALASYVATLSAVLAVMARRTGLNTFGYLLEVRLEAESVSRHSDGPNCRRRSLHLHAKSIQKYRRRIAVRNHAELGLFGADVVAQVEIEVPFEVADVVAELG